MVFQESCAQPGVTILHLGVGALVPKEELKDSSLSICVVNVSSIKPLDEELLEEITKAKLVLTIEEGILNGGFASLVDKYYVSKKYSLPKKGKKRFLIKIKSL